MLETKKMAVLTFKYGVCISVDRNDAPVPEVINLSPNGSEHKMEQDWELTAEIVNPVADSETGKRIVTGQIYTLRTRSEA